MLLTAHRQLQHVREQMFFFHICLTSPNLQLTHYWVHSRSTCKMRKVHPNSAYVTFLSYYTRGQWMCPTCIADSSEENMNIFNCFTISNCSSNKTNLKCADVLWFIFCFQIFVSVVVSKTHNTKFSPDRSAWSVISINYDVLLHCYFFIICTYLLLTKHFSSVVCWRFNVITFNYKCCFFCSSQSLGRLKQQKQLHHSALHCPICICWENVSQKADGKSASGLVTYITYIFYIISPITLYGFL